MRLTFATCRRSGVAFPKSDTFVDGLMVLVMMTVIQRTIGFGRAVLFCRWLTPEQLGEWDLTFAFLELAAPIVVLGVPGTFSRFVEHYRARGQLKSFLRRTGGVSLILVLLSSFVLLGLRSPLQVLLFGGGGSVEMTLLILLILPCVILYNALCELANGLRLVRMNSRMQFVQSFLFAAIGISLVYFRNRGVESVVIAYGSACLVCSIVSWVWIRGVWNSLPAEQERIPQRVFWSTLAPFAASVWVSNWFSNLFMSIDRYMLIHYSRLDPADALAAAGQYHSARVIPILLVTVMGLVSTMLIPFLSVEWEAHGRPAVSAKINTCLKASALVLCVGSLIVLLVAPVLFGWVLAGKYRDGLGVLPLTLAYANWCGMFSIAKTYLWCDRKVSFVSGACVIGILTSIGCNLLLLPRFGLEGAVMSACAANIVALSAVLGFSRLRGMTIDRGTLLVSLLPLALPAGPLVTGGALLLALGGSLWTNWIFDGSERAQFGLAIRRFLERLDPRVGEVTVRTSNDHQAVSATERS